MPSITFESRKWKTNHFTISQNEQVIGSLKIKAFSERGDLIINEVPYQFINSGFFERKYSLNRDGSEILSAKKVSALKSEMVLDFSDKSIHLRKKGLFKRDFEIIENGNTVGQVVMDGWFRIRGHVSLSSEYPIPVMSFLFWIGYLIVQKQNAVSAGVT
jgi:hypothetical protein